MGKLIALVYGFLGYLGFLAAFAYAVGFLTDVLVPKSINDGAESGLAGAILVNVALLGLFGVQHSIMARPWFKKRWTRVISPAVERSTFVWATCVIFALIFWLWRPLPGIVWQVESSALAIVLYGVSALGYLVVVYSTLLIDHFGLFGLRQVWAHFRGREFVQPVFAERGTYRFVRHPLMLGFLVAFWSTPTMTHGYLLFAGVVTVYVLVALQLEEHDLVAEHGESYESYRRRVGMLIPRRRKVEVSEPAREVAASGAPSNL